MEQCVGCHNAEIRESGIRLDQLDDQFPDSSLKLWRAVKCAVASGEMPPSDRPQPSQATRDDFLRQLDQHLNLVQQREVPRHGVVRRLTVSQYANTLQELLGIDDDLASHLPPDAVASNGLINNVSTLAFSPLQLEAYLSIAQQALDIAVVDSAQRPVIQSFRMDLGRDVNPSPYPEALILGANNHLLRNQDFFLIENVAAKSFPFQPIQMQTKWRFVEGYQGNDTVRGWRDYDSLYHAVFACMRGSEGYPQGLAYETIKSGLLLRPAIPSPEIFGESNTYGPHANFKISLRELPNSGRFRVIVTAAKFEDGLILPSQSQRIEYADQQVKMDIKLQRAVETIEIPAAGIYQIDILGQPIPRPANAASQRNLADKPTNPDELFFLRLGDREFRSQWHEPAFLAVRLPQGLLDVEAICPASGSVQSIVFSRLDDVHPTAKAFAAYENRSPYVGVHVGLRRDCGSTLNPVGEPQEVSNLQFQKFVFTGAINNFPRPDVEADNVNYLAGIREVAVRSEYTDGRDLPRLLIKSVEFEGPFYDQWPPPEHAAIFIDTELTDDSDQYAKQVIQAFATRAFRRPVRDEELDRLLSVWHAQSAEANFHRRMTQVLAVVLTMPQFLFLSESSASSDAEALDNWELASKLSYFLWNGPPDAELLEQARQGKLYENLHLQLARLISDERFERFTDEFAAQWLGLEKLDIVSTDRQRYPHLTRHVRKELRQEPAKFLLHLMRNNLSVSHFVQSDLLVANDIVASYYGRGQHTENGFQFAPLTVPTGPVGGLLTQAAILAGLSDGREANPVKRGAWFARRMLDDPPDDPPPNVPKLEDLTHLSIVERLERHRQASGCAKCHEGIDPWGLPFQQYDASGLFQPESPAYQSRMKDGTSVENFEQFQRFLLDSCLGKIAYSFAKHLAEYASGRELAYREALELTERIASLKSEGYRLNDIVQLVVFSDSFLKK